MSMFSFREGKWASNPDQLLQGLKQRIRLYGNPPVLRMIPFRLPFMTDARLTLNNEEKSMRMCGACYTMIIS